MAKQAKVFKLSIILVFIFALICTVLGLLTLSHSVSVTYAQAEGVQLETELDTEYEFGIDLEIPQGQISYKGRLYDSETVVTFPDGKAYKTNEVTLIKTGKYVVEYRAKVDNEYVYVKKTFSVANRLYSYDNDDSYGYYGEHETYTELNEGIVLSLSKGDKVSFNAPLNMRYKTRKDNLITLYLTPNMYGSPDVTCLYVRFTDSEDVDNYITVNIKKASGEWGYLMSYVTANSQEQLPAGRQEKNGKIYIHKNNMYGTSMVLSFAARRVTNGATIAYDETTNSIYVNGYLVADFDDFLFFNTLWNGFPSGKAYVSIWSDSFASDSLGLMVTKYGDYDLSASSYDGIESPKITVDYQGYDQNSIPSALVGMNYKLFDASAYDKIEGEISVTKTVWYNYYSDNPARVNVTDNKFLASCEGVYTVVYEAVNKFGISSKIVLDVNSIKPKDIEMEIEGLNNAIIVGQKTKLFDSLTFTNCIGNYDYEIIAIPQNNTEVRISVNQNGENFKPTYSGVYKLKVIVSDYIRTKEFVSEFTVGSSDLCMFGEDDIDLPEFFIKNVRYELPTIKGYNFASGMPVEMVVSIFVSEDGGAEKPLIGHVYTPKSTNVSKIIYKIDGTDVKLEKEVSIIDVNYGNSFVFNKYFRDVIGTTSRVPTKSYTKFYFDNNTAIDGTVELKYIQKIRWDKFKGRFGFDNNERNFDSFYVLLNDELMVAFKKLANGYLEVSINGTQNYSVSKIYDTFINEFEIAYNNTTKSITIDSEYTFEVKNDINGEAFSGFDAENISFALGCTGISGSCALKIYSVNDCVFTTFDDDLIGPNVKYDRNCGDCSVGDVVLISPAYAFDMFSPVYDFLLTVSYKDSDNVKHTMTALDGTVLKNVPSDNYYEIKVNQIGIYIVEYAVVDSNGNKTNVSYAISVIDNVSPAISLDKSGVKATVGSTVTLKSVQVSDNVDENLSVIVIVKNPDGKLQRIDADGNGERKLDCSQKGQYVVYYMAYDQTGNVTTENYVIVVQ